jgi:hypothetical protein
VSCVDQKKISFSFLHFGPLLELPNRFEAFLGFSASGTPQKMTKMGENRKILFFPETTLV